MLNVLLFAMCCDYLTGIIVAAKGKSNKTKGGHLSSKAGFWGLAKKCLILLILAMAYSIDLLVNANGLLYNAVVLFYISNECISCLENLVKLDIKIPNKLKTVIEELGEDDDAG